VSHVSVHTAVASAWALRVSRGHMHAARVTKKRPSERRMVVRVIASMRGAAGGGEGGEGGGSGMRTRDVCTETDGGARRRRGGWLMAATDESDPAAEAEAEVEDVVAPNLYQSSTPGQRAAPFV
jgi:hypothetical protein